MTALIMPARPKHDADLRPVPWRRMAWVTWRQHRTALTGVAVLLVALAACFWVAGLQLHHAYAAAIARGELPATFHPAELGAITNWILLQGTLFWAVGAVGPLTLEQTLWRRVQLVVHGARLTGLAPWPGATAPTSAPSEPPG